MAFAPASPAPALADGDFVRLRRRFEFARFILRRKVALLCVLFLSFFYLCGIFAPLIAPEDPNHQTLSLEARRSGPSSDHLLGTDALGRDLFSRVIYSARTTTIITVVIVLTGEVVVGLGLGLLAGYRGGWIDTAIMRTGEVLSGMPTLVIMLALTAAFRPRINEMGFWLQDHTFLAENGRTVVRFTLIGVVSLPFAWVGTSRIIRGQVLAMREQEFISAAEAMGASTGRIIWRHIFPGLLPLLIVGISSGMAGIAGTEVSLSYLGLGVEPPTASFGSMISDAGGVSTFQNYPHLLLASSLPVIIFFFSWTLLGDALVDYFEPRHRRT